MLHNATTNIFFRDEPRSKVGSFLASPQAIVEESTGMRLGYKKRQIARMNQSMTIDPGDRNGSMRKDLTIHASKALLQEDQRAAARLVSSSLQAG